METRAPLTILIADVDVSAAGSLRDALASPELHVELVASGGEALRRLRLGGVQLLILDTSLREMGGLELLASLRLAGQGVRTIVTTATPCDAFEFEARRLGALLYATKPVAPWLVQMVLDRFRAITPEAPRTAEEATR